MQIIGIIKAQKAQLNLLSLLDLKPEEVVKVTEHQPGSNMVTIKTLEGKVHYFPAHLVEIHKGI